MVYARRFIEANSTITDVPNYGLPCPKCGLKSIVRKQQQTRSNDEGASIGFFCNNGKCRHTWVKN
jgi:DNA-directed RNA polymerase subunit M/transcription elongation factor TFIIS